MSLLTGAIDQVATADTAQPESAAGPLSTVMSQPQNPEGSLSAVTAPTNAPEAPDYASMINQAYSTVGRSGIGTDPNQIDQAGYDYWLNQLQTGAIAPEDFQNQFNQGAESVYINQAYQDLFGRTPEETDLQYWQNQLNTTNKDEIYNAIASGGRDYITNLMASNANDPYAIYSAAQKYNVNPETITSIFGYSDEEASDFTDKYNRASAVANEYRDIGRELTGENAIDEEGFNYWYNKLESGEITPEQFEQAFLTGALDVVERGYDADVSSNAVIEALTKGYGGAELLNKADPLDLFESTRDQGITAEALLSRNPNLDADQLNTMLGQAPELYNTFITDSATNILGEGGTSQIDDAYKSQLVDALMSGDLTREEFDTALQQSPSNQVQEANRIANLGMSALGFTEEEAIALRANLLGEEYTGDATLSEEDLKFAREAFNTALTSEEDAQTSLTKLIDIAADREGAENTEFFKNNPNALLVYGDLKTRSDDPWAKYGEINGAAIYDASAVDKYMDALGGDDPNSVAGFAHRDTRRLGIDPGGIIDGGSAFIKRGAAVLGLEKSPEYSYDSEGGQTTTGKFNISGDINAAAQQVGINPADFKDTYKTVTNTDEYGNTYQTQVLDKTAAEQIYDAINEKAKNLYVIGNVNPDNINDKSENNFMYTAYQRTEDGKLIPINKPTLYTGAINPDVYKKKGMFGGGFLGDMAQSFAGIPFVSEAAFIASGGNPAVYAAAKGVQAAAFSNSLSDVGKAATIAYVSTAGLPNPGNVGSAISGGTLAANSVAAVTLGGAAMGAATGGVMAALSGQDVTKGITMGMASGSLAANAANIGNTLLPAETMQSIASTTGLSPDKVATLIGNSINGGVLAGITGQNITEAIINNLVVNGVSALTANQIASNMQNQGLDENALRTIANATAQTMGTVTRAALGGQDIKTALNFAAPSILTGSAMNYGMGLSRAAKNQNPLVDNRAVESGVEPGLSTVRVKEGGIINMKTGGKVKGGLPAYEDGGYIDWDSVPSIEISGVGSYGDYPEDFDIDFTGRFGGGGGGYDHDGWDYDLTGSYGNASNLFDYDFTDLFDSFGDGGDYDLTGSYGTASNLFDHDYTDLFDSFGDGSDLRYLDISGGISEPVVVTDSRLEDLPGLGNQTAGEFIAEDVFSLKEQGLSDEAVRQALGQYATTSAIDDALANYNSGMNREEVSSFLDELGETSGLELQDYNDKQFQIMDGRTLWENTGDAAAVQQNLIASGSDPLVAATITQMLAEGKSDTEIYEEVTQVFGDASYGPAFNPEDSSFWDGSYSSSAVTRTGDLRSGGGGGGGGGGGRNGGGGGGGGGTRTPTKRSGAAPDAHSIANLTAELTKRLGDLDLVGVPNYRRKIAPSFKFAEGGSVMDHNPQFFSEGGLNSMENRYVRGDGDGTSDSVPAMLANGEFVIPADVVSALGNGSNDSGAGVLDEFMRVIRDHKRNADAKHLPPDSKGALQYLKEAKRKV